MKSRPDSNTSSKKIVKEELKKSSGAIGYSGTMKYSQANGTSSNALHESEQLL